MTHVRWDNPESISLHEVYDEFPFGMPPVQHTTETTEWSVRAVMTRRMNDLLMQHVRATLISLHQGTGEPKTALHALMLEDNQTIGRIAAQLHQPPDTFMPDLGVLVETGWVEIDKSTPLTTYSLT